MTNLVGNEVNHIGAALLQRDFIKHSRGSRLARLLRIGVEFLLLCAFFGVIILLCVALQ